MNKNTILLTGGHAGSTALATIKQLQKIDKNLSIHWVGAASAFTKSKSQTLEAREYQKHSITYHKINAGKIPRKITLQAIKNALLLPMGFIQAFLTVRKINPQVVVSFGGFVGFPVVLAAYAHKKPILLQEQIVTAGLGNRLSSGFAKKIAIGRQESAKHFPRHKTVLTGIPISSHIGKVAPKKKIGNPPTIVITGGSRGAKAINEVIRDSLNLLLKKYKVIHLTGQLDHKKIAGNNNYKAITHVSPAQMANLYQQADILISRAGANTIAEIIAVGRPAILVPLPTTWFDEQRKNAALAKNIGIAEVIEQDDFNTKSLVEALQKVEKNWAKMVKHYDRSLADLDKGAATTLAKMITQELT
jgi:UDP-N-acetylglucosamine--N-acetylmuramyl-(pentapeptide) pyrophosphoryl-undecaprenol N-acetylglucosamine transferase